MGATAAALAIVILLQHRLIVRAHFLFVAVQDDDVNITFSEVPGKPSAVFMVDSIVNCTTLV